MGAAENKELVRKMFAELGSNPKVFLDAMADDVEFKIIGSTRFSGTFKGKAELVEKVLRPLTANLAGGLTITPSNLFGEGDWVAMESQGRADTKNGKTYNNTYCHIFHLSGGKVVRMVEYLDTELVTAIFGR